MKSRPEHIEQCEKVFITWRWGVLGILGTIGLIVSAVYGYVCGEKDQDAKIISAELRIEKIENIKIDIDTIKVLLKEMSK